jgi:2-polyprenyl-3-methyl-5-hydroxy-6-metoxy-1,4-benzoquinol methylase
MTGKTVGRSSGTPILQVPAEVWNSEYTSGLWNRLSDVDEVGHYAVLLGFLIYSQANRAILDIGCGKAVLLEYLRRSCGYKHYMGIDISEVAIEANCDKSDEYTFFLRGNIELLCPVGPFDAIVFNECLYYLADPFAVIDTCTSRLSDHGVFMTSLFVSNEQIAVLADDLKNRYPVLADIEISNDRGKWRCNLFARPTTGTSPSPARPKGEARREGI